MQKLSIFVVKMPRPTNKQDLLQASQKNFEQLNALINALSEEDRNKDFPPGTMNRNIRDALGHLHVWHIMLLGWYEIGMQGKKPDMPAEGYTWRDTPALNRKIWEDNLQYNLLDTRLRFEQSHQAIHALIEKHTDEELFEKKKYKWTGSTSLGAYLVSSTVSHYEWAIRLIKQSFKM